MELMDVLKEVTFGAPLQWKGLQVFPLVQPNGHAPTYALIDDLLDHNQAEIHEVSEGGSVPTISAWYSSPSARLTSSSSAPSMT